MERDFCDFVPK